ncbi:CPBP family intramembrane glutamic endopeptidase [Rubrobacter naiadicus]|uniref:CPBP family intramembrane glutamic endopeptidase n=1 Tax=Rubrobacter naiadicus TaxID=1392641 RepID=UPI00235F33DD|nr:type II CAAX endopeptidase family protein [Rubrobacter naiadicus]
MRPLVWIFLEGGGETSRPRALWRLLLQFVLWQILAGIFAGILFVSWRAAGGGGIGLSLVGFVANLPAVLVSVWLSGRFFDRRRFEDFGFHLRRRWLYDLLFGLALGAALISGVFAVEDALGWVKVRGTLESLLPGLPFATALLPVLVLYLCVGIYEETFSRGYQLRNLAEGLNLPFIGERGAVVAAWVLSSAFFGLLHLFNPNATAVSAANVALAGLLLGTGYVLTGELAIPIGIHITWNIFEGVVYGLPVSGTSPVGAVFFASRERGPDVWTGGAFGPEGGLLVTAAVLVGMVITAGWVKLSRGRLGIREELARRPGDDGAKSDRMR